MKNPFKLTQADMNRAHDAHRGVDPYSEDAIGYKRAPPVEVPQDGDAAWLIYLIGALVCIGLAWYFWP